jgi:hypothetical protein
VELMDEPLEVRARELKLEVLDAGAEEGLALRTQRRLRAVAGIRLRALVEGRRGQLWPGLRLRPLVPGGRRRLRRLLGLCLGCGGGGGHGGTTLTSPAGAPLPDPEGPV